VPKAGGFETRPYKPGKKLSSRPCAPNPAVAIALDASHKITASIKDRALMIQKTSETIAQTIARVHGDARKSNHWLAIEKIGGGAYMIGDDLTCHADSVEFTDEGGVHAVVPYAQIISIEVRRRG